MIWKRPSRWAPTCLYQSLSKMYSPSLNWERNLSGTASTPPVKKKIRPYPFEGTIELNTVKRQLEVIYITPAGFIAKLKNCIISVGEHYQAVMELPVSHNFVNSPVRVIKTYDRAVDPKQHLVD